MLGKPLLSSNLKFDTVPSAGQTTGIQSPAINLQSGNNNDVSDCHFAFNNGKKDTGNLIADHITWAGNRTQEVHGDDCKIVDGTMVHNVEGDYHLSVTGDMQLSVGGALNLNAQGAPRTVDKNGKKMYRKVSMDVYNALVIPMNTDNGGVQFEDKGDHTAIKDFIHKGSIGLKPTELVMEELKWKYLLRSAV